MYVDLTWDEKVLFYLNLPLRREFMFLDAKINKLWLGSICVTASFKYQCAFFLSRPLTLSLNKKEQITLMIVKNVRVMTFMYVPIFSILNFNIMCAILCIILRLNVVRKAVKYFFTVSFFIGLFTVIFRSVVYKIEQNVISLSWGGVDTNAIEQIQWHFYLSVLMGQVLDYNCRNKWTTLWAKLHIWCFLMLGTKKNANL